MKNLFLSVLILSKVRNQSGLTLIEVALSLIILSLITAAGISLHSRAQLQQQTLVTRERMDIIVQALSVYAETAGRTPCAAAPEAADITFGWERGVVPADLTLNAGKFPIPSPAVCNTTNNVGIVPFMTLNLSPDVAKDGWGRYFTYAVSPQFARTNDQSRDADNQINNADKDQGTVHGRCRAIGWAPVMDGRNLNAVKARYCCLDRYSSTVNGNQANFLTSASDLVIRHTTATTNILSPRRVADSAIANVGNLYDSINISTLQKSGGKTLPVALTNSQYPVLVPAFVLVSHGKNGYGAYLANGTANQFNTTASLSPLEQENFNFTGTAPVPDRTFVDGPITTAISATYFDDIVRWMTQDSLMAAHGALSCQYP